MVPIPASDNSSSKMAWGMVPSSTVDDFTPDRTASMQQFTRATISPEITPSFTRAGTWESWSSGIRLFSSPGLARMPRWLVSSSRRSAPRATASLEAAVSALTALIGSALGTRLNLFLSEKALHYVLIVLLPIIAVFLFFHRDFGLESKVEAMTPGRLTVLSGCIGLALGAYDGFFGPGAGPFIILAFTALCGFDLVTASGNAKVVNLCSNIAAFVTFAFAGKILWTLGLPAACCSIAGHYVGSSLALKDGAKIIRPMFFVVLALLLARIAWDLMTGI